MKYWFEELRLAFRYYCRRLGLPGFRIHQILLKQQKLIYIPIPKNVSTTLKHALHEIEFGIEFNANLPKFSQYKEHHDYYLKRADAFTSVKELEAKTEYEKITVIRDPVKRFMSCYRNRVIDLGDLLHNEKDLQRLGLSSKPDLNTFVKNLEIYRNVNKSIKHHTNRQAYFLGNKTKYLDHIFKFSEMEKLQFLLRNYKRDLQFYKRKTGGTKVTLKELSSQSLDKLIQFYADDYALLSQYFSPDSIIKEHKAG